MRTHVPGWGAGAGAAAASTAGFFFFFFFFFSAGSEAKVGAGEEEVLDPPYRPEYPPLPLSMPPLP